MLTKPLWPCYRVLVGSKPGIAKTARKASFCKLVRNSRGRSCPGLCGAGSTLGLLSKIELPVEKLSGGGVGPFFRWPGGASGVNFGGGARTGIECALRSVEKAKTPRGSSGKNLWRHPLSLKQEGGKVFAV